MHRDAREWEHGWRIAPFVLSKGGQRERRRFIITVS